MFEPFVEPGDLPKMFIFVGRLVINDLIMQIKGKGTF